MTWFLIACGFATALTVMGFGLSARLRPKTAPACNSVQGAPTAVIVPCKGAEDPDFSSNIRKLAAQEFAGIFQLIFVVESEDDSAVGPIRELIQASDGKGNVHLCTAGLAESAGQKSHNIVQAIRKMRQPVEIVVIADCDIAPHKTWLAELVAPLDDPTLDVATGFFQIAPLRRSWGNYLSAVFGVALWHGVASDWIGGIWGGSMAMRASLLDELDLETRFAEEIVDDILVMHALQLKGRRRAYVPTCLLPSPCDRSFSALFAWFVRQVQYSQIYFPRIFLATHLLVFPLAMALLAAPVLIGIGMVQSWPGLVWAGGGILVAQTVNALLLRPGSQALASEHDTPALDWDLWVGAMFLAPLVAAAALVQTHRCVRRGALKMTWRGIQYEVDLKSRKVLSVKHRSEPKSDAESRLEEEAAPVESEAHQPTASIADGHQAVRAN